MYFKKICVHTRLGLNSRSKWNRCWPFFLSIAFGFLITSRFFHSSHKCNGIYNQLNHGIQKESNIQNVWGPKVIKSSSNVYIGMFCWTVLCLVYLDNITITQFPCPFCYDLAYDIRIKAMIKFWIAFYVLNLSVFVLST